MATFPANKMFYAFAVPIEQGASKGKFLAAFSIGNQRFILNNIEFETSEEAIEYAVDEGTKQYSRQVLQDALHNNDE